VMSNQEQKKPMKNFQKMTAEDLMKSDPSAFPQDATAQAIATELVKKKSGAITIVNQERKPVGIVTEYDLLKAIKEGKDLEKTRPAEMMTEPVIVSEKAPMDEVLDTLVTGHLIHIPVVNHEEKLVGLIERQDVLSAYLQSKRQ
jgi:CBS domain-containing protein